MARSVLNAPQFQTEEAAFEYVEARLWPHGPTCPHCGEAERIGRLSGKTTRVGLRKCYSCRKPFTVRSGTIFESSHLPLHLWLQVIHLMCASKKGISTRQIQRMLDCSMKTAWFLTHRIREAMAEKHGIFTPPLGGAGKVIEADEAFIGRDATKKLAGPGPQFPVLSLVEREGKVRSFYIANVSNLTVHSVLARHADMASRLMPVSKSAMDLASSAGVSFLGSWASACPLIVTASIIPRIARIPSPPSGSSADARPDGRCTLDWAHGPAQASEANRRTAPRALR